MAPVAPRSAAMARLTNVLFVNSGILGMALFSAFIREAIAADPGIDAVHVDLSQDMSIEERIIRSIMCTRLWRDGLLGVKNMDLERIRSEVHAGLQARRRIGRLLADRAIDVIHFHRQATAYGSVDLMARLPSIVSIDSTQDIVIDAALSPIERWTYGPNARMDGRVFCAAKAIVSTSQWAADTLRRRYPECRTPVHVMPTPVRLKHFDPRWIDQRSARSGAPGYRPRVLFMGGDFVRKGGTDLLRAWIDGRLHDEADLDLVTDWPIAGPLPPGVRLVRSLSAYSSEWVDLWRTADLFVLPSRQDAFATVYQEAAAAGLPRIGTRMGAIPETIHDDEDGLLIDVSDHSGLIAALKRLIASPHLREQFGRAGRRRAEGFGPDRYVAMLQSIVRSVVRIAA